MRTITIIAALLVASNTYAVDNSWYFDKTRPTISPEAYALYEEERAAKNEFEGKIWIDVNFTSWHSQEYYYTEEPVYYQAHPRYDHLPKTEIVAHEFNDDNPGVFLRFELHENWDVGAGVVKDSFYQTSWMVGTEWHTKRSRGVSIGVLGALAPAYADAPVIQSPIIVIPVLQVNTTSTYPTIGARVLFQPFGEVKYGTVQLTMGF